MVRVGYSVNDEKSRLQAFLLHFKSIFGYVVPIESLVSF